MIILHAYVYLFLMQSVCSQDLNYRISTRRVNCLTMARLGVHALEMRWLLVVVGINFYTPARGVNEQVWIFQASIWFQFGKVKYNTIYAFGENNESGIRSRQVLVWRGLIRIVLSVHVINSGPNNYSGIQDSGLYSSGMYRMHCILLTIAPGVQKFFF